MPTSDPPSQPDRRARWGSAGVVALLAAVSLYAHFTSKDYAQGKSFAYFEAHVAPILASTCSGKDASGAYVCHGQPASQLGADAIKAYARAAPHMLPTALASSCGACHGKSGKMRFSFALGAGGELATQRHRLLAFEKARVLTRYTGKANFARLLRMPLASQAGGFGLYHGGGEVFDSATDPEFQKLARWVVLENAAGSKKQVKPSPAEIAFRDEVLPVLARNTCLAPSCHIFNHSAFIPDPGMPSLDLAKPLAERFSPEQVRFNRMTSKGLIQSLVYLTGTVTESRFLKKLIPLDKGGVMHRGGNAQFIDGPDDPDFKAIAKWLALERKEAIDKVRIGGKPVAADDVGRIRGVVFVRTKTDNHRRYVDVGKYLPGGDLYLLALAPGETLETAKGKPVNLTARFHPDSEADIREPDVRYDGRAIVFSMRIGEADNLNLYEITLGPNLEYVDKSFRRLTYGPKTKAGFKVHYTDPTYVPDPADKGAAGGGFNLEKVDLVFASNIAGEVARSVERGIVGEADGGDRDSIVDFDRPEASGSFVGKRIYILDGTNKGAWRTITKLDNQLFSTGRSFIEVDRPFDKPVDVSTIYYIERDAKTQPGFLPSYSVYGMKYPSLGREKYFYDETLSRITMTPGQDLDLSVRTTGEVFYSSQRSACDKYGRPVFHMASCRRHLDTRFSFPTHHGNRSQVLIYADNHELPTGIDIHVGLDPDNLWEGGNLSVSDHQFGPGLEARNPHDLATGYFDEHGTPRTERADHTNTHFKFKGRQPSLTRFVFKKTPLFPLRGPKAVSRTGYSPGGIYRDPIPLPDGGILVSHSPAAMDHLDPEAKVDFDLYVLRGDPSFQPKGGKGVPRIRKAKLSFAAAGVSEVQAHPIYVRLKPKLNAGRRPKRDHLIRHPGMKKDTPSGTLPGEKLPSHRRDHARPIPGRQTRCL